MTRRLLLVLCVLLMTGIVAAQDDDTYTVRLGDALPEIAEQLNLDLACLMDANDIANPSLIQVGQVLTITDDCRLDDATIDLPPDEEAVPLAEQDDDPAEAAESDDDTDDSDDTAALGQGGGVVEDTTYIVQRGDTLARIANRFETTITCLISDNAIPDPDLIYAGQELFIGADCAAGQGGGGTDVSGTTITSDAICRGDRNPNRVAVDGVYVVQAGDMLDFIGCDFGVQTECLSEINDLNPPGAIEIGQTLIIDLSCPAWEAAYGAGSLD